MKTSEVRIIGGRWRGRKVVFASLSKQLRPTPGSVRETLFNWLATRIDVARCLDLYAGSGALGIEALSRGAADVTFVDAERRHVRMLQDNLHRLGATASVYCMDARRFVRQIGGKWDIIFLDPPFRHDMLKEIISLLFEHECIGEDSLIYIESERELPSLNLPPGWNILKQKSAGQLEYCLVGKNENGRVGI